MWVYEHTIEVMNITAEQIWATYQNVSAWPSWDSELQSASLLGNFEVGSKIIIKPKKGPKAKAVITECVPFEKFTDMAILPLKTELIFSHQIKKNSKNVKLTHRVSIDGPLTFIFKRLIGRSIVKHLPSAMEKLMQVSKSKEGSYDK